MSIGAIGAEQHQVKPATGGRSSFRQYNKSNKELWAIDKLVLYLALMV